MNVQNKIHKDTFMGAVVCLIPDPPQKQSHLIFMSVNVNAGRRLGNSTSHLVNCPMLWLILIRLQLDDIKSIFNYFFCREKALSFGSWLSLLKAVPTANQPQSQSDIYSKEVCRDLTFENSGVEAGGPPLLSLLPWLEVREMEECGEGIHTLKSKRHRCLVLMHRACFSPCPPPQQCVFK